MSDDNLPLDREGRWKKTAREAAQLVGAAAWRIVTRTLAWGSLGLGVAIAAFATFFATGMLDVRRSWAPWLLLGLLPVYLAAGAGLLGYAGLWCGIGRTLLVIGIERGLVASLAERILERASDAMRRSVRMGAMLDRGDQLLRDIPLQTAEEALKDAVGSVFGEGDLKGEATGLSARVASLIQRALARRIEKYLLASFRAEVTSQGGGGVDIGKLLAVAPQQTERAVEKMIRGSMTNVLVLMSIAALGVFLLPPIVIHFAR